MTLLQKLRNFSGKKPAFKQMLAILENILSPDDPNRDDIAEVVLQMRFNPAIVIEGSRIVFIRQVLDQFNEAAAAIGPVNYLLFVYGTLKRGFPLHRHMENGGAVFLRDVRTIPLYRLWVPIKNGWYPLMTKDSKSGVSVEGELWCVNEQHLLVLDRVETEGGFIRHEVELESPPEDLVETYLYKYEPDNGLIDCGSSWQGPVFDPIWV